MSNDEVPPYFWKQLREERLAWGMKQEQLAKRLDVSVSYYSAIETGRKPPSPSLFNDICEILKLDTEAELRLQAAAVMSVKQIRIDVSDYPQETRKMIFNFARNISGMSDFEIRKMRDFIERRRINLKAG